MRNGFGKRFIRIVFHALLQLLFADVDFIDNLHEQRGVVDRNVINYLVQLR